jgi:hypothetical protein
MKKMLVLLAVTMIAANSVGCCCRGLCPWLDRGAACCPLTPAAAPLVAAPGCPPQYGAPMVAPMAAQMANPTSSYWDPCQCAVVGQPGYAPTGYAQPSYAQPGFAQPGFGQAQPMMAAPGMMSYAEPNCGYAAEPACGGPFMGEVSYGPSFTSDCAECGVVSDGAFSAPPPETYGDPQPVE